MIYNILSLYFSDYYVLLKGQFCPRLFPRHSSFTTHVTSQYRETRRLLTDVQDYINEKPDSAIVVLKSYRGLASQDEGTEALYAMLITKAEYIATDSIASDSLIQGAVKYYNKESDNSEMILE